ncbi:hypothetical protein MTO96_011342 [Rhipicephalus appendiculatus]
MARAVARRAPDEEKSACVIEMLKGTSYNKICRQRRELESANVVKFMKNRSLKLLLSDKTGAFVVIDEPTYKDLATRAIEKNFFKAAKNEIKPKQLKKEAVHLCSVAQLEKLEKAVRLSKELCLKPFFSVKTHKDFVLL